MVDRFADRSHLGAHQWPVGCAWDGHRRSGRPQTAKRGALLFGVRRDWWPRGCDTAHLPARLQPSSPRRRRMSAIAGEPTTSPPEPRPGNRHRFRGLPAVMLVLVALATAGSAFLSSLPLSTDTMTESVPAADLREVEITANGGICSPRAPTTGSGSTSRGVGPSGLQPRPVQSPGEYSV